MANLSTQGIGSGLDIAGIVSKIMTIERAPWVQMGTDQVEMQAQLSAYGQLKSVVDDFKTSMTELNDAAKFKATKATSSDTTVLTATASADASRGSYAVEVKRLAETHRLVAGTVFADNKTTKLGTAGDTMAITVGTKSFTVDIGNKTLDEIRTAINSATSNTGVTASTLKDANGYHLTLAAEDTGSSNFVSVKYHTLAGGITDQPDPFALTTINTDRNGSGSFTSADLDAELKIENTYTVTSSSNSVSDVMSGLTLDLVAPGTVNLSVARDDGKIQSAVEQMISSYNAVFKLTGDLQTKTLSSERGSLQNIESQFRGALHAKSGNSSAFKFLAEIGVTNAAKGAGLTLNTTIFQEALSKDPDGVASMFTDPNNGMAGRFQKLADSMLGVGGILPGREASTQARIDASKKDRDNLNYRLNLKEAALNKQFNAMDVLVGSLNSTTTYLKTQLAQFTANKNA